jgi:hypothetical protein
MSEPQLIAIIRKNSLEEIRVCLSEYNGVDLIDLRIFGDFTGSRDDKRATRKGIALNIRKLPELIQALLTARAEAERRGLLTGAAPAS